jgi:hypothetical protein
MISLQVLSPRSDIGVYQSGKNRRKKLKDGSGGDKDKGGGGDAMAAWDSTPGRIDEQRDPTSMVSRQSHLVSVESSILPQDVLVSEQKNPTSMVSRQSCS